MTWYCPHNADGPIHRRNRMESTRRLFTALIIWIVSFAALASDLPRTDPESVGISSERLETLHKALSEKVDKGVIPGYVALVARHGKVAWVDAYGMQDPNTKKPMETDAI